MCANPVFSMKWPFGVDVAMVSVIFVWFGYFTEQNLRKLVDKLKIWQNCLISILLLVIVFCLSMLNLPTSVTEGFNHVEMSIGSYGNIGLFLITALFGSFAIICLSTLIKSQYLSMMGRSTMTCLVTHSIEISSVTFVLSQLGVESLYIRSMVSFCVILIVTIPINAMLMYFCPNIIGKHYNCVTSVQGRNSRETQ